MEQCLVIVDKIYQVVKNSIHAFNYEIVTELNNSEYGKLHLAQRRINVTLNGYNANSVDATSFASKIYPLPASSREE